MRDTPPTTNRQQRAETAESFAFGYALRGEPEMKTKKHRAKCKARRLKQRRRRKIQRAWLHR